MSKVKYQRKLKTAIVEKRFILIQSKLATIKLKQSPAHSR
jgi:hypothetical protein